MNKCRPLKEVRNHCPVCGELLNSQIPSPALEKWGLWTCPNAADKLWRLERMRKVAFAMRFNRAVEKYGFWMPR